MRRAVLSTVAGALALVLTMASPAGASGPYDTSESDSGRAGSANATWTASSDISTAGEFDNAVAITESGTTFDAQHGYAAAQSSALSSFTLEPGDYVGTVAFADVSIVLASSGFANATAQVNLMGPGDAEWLETGGDSIIQSSVGGVAVPAGSVTNRSGSIWVKFRVSEAGSYTFGGYAHVNANTGVANDLVNAHGGSSSGRITGRVDSITVAPA